MSWETFFLIVLIIFCPLAHFLMMGKMHQQENKEDKKGRNKKICH